MRIRTKLRNKVVRTDVIIRISLFTIFLWNIIFAAYLRAPVLNLFHDTEDAAASLEDGCDHGTTTRPYPGGTTSSSSALRSSSTAPGGVLVTDTGGAPLPIQEAHIITHDEEITRTASTTTTNGISRTTSMAGAPKHHHLVGSSSSSMTSTAISSSSWLQCSDYAIKLIHGLPLEDEEEDDRRRDGVNPIRSMSSSSTTFNGTTNADVLHDDDNTNTRTKCDINHKNNLLDFKNQQQQQVKNNTTSSTDEANDGGKNKKKVIDDDGTSPSLSLLPSKKNDNKVPCVCMILTTYNVVGYVSNAMEHILNQTHKHLEIIVVDDHSSDGTLELLLQKYGLGTAEKIGGTNRTTLAGTTTTTSSSSSNNPSITLQVVSLKQNTNGGTGQPSNIGMESCSSSSEYIMFADGDDYMELDTVETMVGLAKKFDAQVVVGNHDEIHQNDDGSTYLKPSGAFPKWETIPANKPFNVVTHPQILQTSPAPWRKLYQRSFLMDYKIQFPEGDYFYEDTTFHWDVMIHATRCCKIDRTLFHYRRARVGQTSYVLTSNRGGEDAANHGPYSLVEMVDQFTKVAKMGGVLPNIHHIRRILSNETLVVQEHENPLNCMTLDDKKIIIMKYFELLQSFTWFGHKQGTNEMKAKFGRRLEQIGQIWPSHLQEQGNITFPKYLSKPLKQLKSNSSGKKHRNKVDLSIVIPTFNSGGSSIQKLLDQIYTELSTFQSNFDFEIFCVDRGSTDDTFSTLKSVAERELPTFYLMSLPNSTAGEGRARNQPISFLEGKYVYFLNVDNAYNFTALAQSVVYAEANQYDVLILPPSSVFDQNDDDDDKQKKVVDETAKRHSTARQDDLILRTVVKELKNPNHQIQKHAALALSSSLLPPWKQITSTKLVFDNDIAFGPSRENYDIQFHWLSIAASKNLHFYDRPVWSAHHPQSNAVDDLLSKYGDDETVSELFSSIGIAQRAMAKSGVFQAKDGVKIFQQWKCFVNSLLKTAENRVPHDAIPKFNLLYNHFHTHVLSYRIPPKDLQRFPYWGASRFEELESA